MGILDKLTGKKPEEQPTAAESAKTEKQKTVASAGAAVHHGSGILMRPQLSEKGMHLANTGRYIFAVTKNANKSEIKKSIQKIYNVHVTDVNIVNIPSKKRRYGKTQGETSALKKAIVTLKRGEKISGIIESVG